METILDKESPIDVQLEIKKEFVKLELERITENYSDCNNKILDALDDLREGFVATEQYELAQVSKDFKIELIKRTGFLETI